jgi:hypothetical protein
VIALIAADTPIAQLAGPAVFHSAMAGSDATLIVVGVTSLNYYLMGRPEIKTPGSSKAVGRDQPLRLLLGLHRPLRFVESGLDAG